MAGIKEFSKITDAFIMANGVQSLADRPNQPSRYGAGGLTAAELKKRFDLLTTEVIKKYNALVTALSDPEVAASYIALRSVEGGVETLADFLASAVDSDAFASELLVNENGETLTQVLKTIRDTLDARVLDITDGDLAKTLIVDTEKKTTLTTALGTLDSKLTSLNADIESGDLADRMIANVPDKDGYLTPNTITNHLALLEQEIAEAANAYDDADDRITTIESAYLSKTKTTEQTLAGPLKVPEINAPDVKADRIYAIESIGTMQNIYADGTVSAPEMEVGWKLEAKQAEVTGNLEVGGDLIVKGATQTAKLENLTIKDNVVIVNSGGINFANSGLVIATSATAKGGYVAYGILYGDTDEVVSIGKGVLKYDENGNASFAFDANEAVPLAARLDGFTEGAIPLWDAEKNAFKSSGTKLDALVARSGSFNTGEVPIWDASKNAFKSSGIKLDEVCITEYDYEITEPSQFTTENLATMSGAVLVNCDLFIDGYSEPVTITIPDAIKVLNLNGHRIDVDLDGHSGCRLMNAHFVVGGNWEAGYEQYVSGFASVEFCRGAGVYYNCDRIAHSDIWRASGCHFITDVQTHPYEYEDTVFSNCTNITNVRVSDIYNDDVESNVEFDSCSHISNVSFVGDRDGVIKYYNCTYVDALTCYGYRAFYYDDEAESDYQSDATYGVPYIDANGIVSFLERAEGGSYGS